ncbi:hypothetical protein ACHAPT_012762 [Fusarium lateritium]
MDRANITSVGFEWPLVKFSHFPIDHVWTACIFAYWTPHMLRMLRSKTYARAHHYHRSLLIVHSAISVIEVVLFHAKTWQLGHDPTANNLDLVLCIGQAVTSLVMAERMRFLPKLTLELSRGTFQCMAIQRMLASGLAIYLNSPEWHRASIKLLTNFIWVRFIITWSGKFAGVDTYQHGYSAGVVGGHLMGMWEGNYPHGIAIYMGLLMSLLALDRWAQKFDK